MRSITMLASLLIFDSMTPRPQELETPTILWMLSIIRMELSGHTWETVKEGLTPTFKWRKEKLTSSGSIPGCLPNGTDGKLTKVLTRKERGWGDSRGAKPIKVVTEVPNCYADKIGGNKPPTGLNFLLFLHQTCTDAKRKIVLVLPWFIKRNIQCHTWKVITGFQNYDMYYVRWELWWYTSFTTHGMS